MRGEPSIRGPGLAASAGRLEDLLSWPMIGSAKRTTVCFARMAPLQRDPLGVCDPAAVYLVVLRPDDETAFIITPKDSLLLDQFHHLPVGARPPGRLPCAFMRPYARPKWLTSKVLFPYTIFLSRRI